MRRGEVIFSRKFKFSDGGEAKKFLIVLNEGSTDHPHLLLLASSQQWNRKLLPGCYAKENYFVIKEKSDWFDKATWVLFDPIIEYSFKKELEEHFKNNLETTTILREETIRAIINCLTQSEDITPYQISLINSERLTLGDKVNAIVIEKQ